PSSSAPSIMSAADASFRDSRSAPNKQSLEPQWSRTAGGISSISPDGRWLGSYGSFSPFLDIYRLPRMEHVVRLRSLAYVGEFTFSPGSDQVAICSRSGVEFFHVGTWPRTRFLTTYPVIAFSPMDA